MNLFLRLIYYIIKALRSEKFQSIFDISEINLRVLPNDLDSNMHMNNGRFLTIMDIGRTDMTIRMNLHKVILKNSWYPVVGGVNIIYLKSLMPFEKYKLRTSIVYWDEKWVYIKQDFIKKNGDISSSAIVKAIFKKGRETVKISELVDILGFEKNPPSIPKYLEHIFDGEKELISVSKSQK